MRAMLAGVSQLVKTGYIGTFSLYFLATNERKSEKKNYAFGASNNAGQLGASACD